MRHNAIWTQSNEELIELIISEIKENGLENSREFTVRKEKLGIPTSKTLYKRGINFFDIQQAYKNKYGKPISTPSGMFGWRYYTTEELVDMVADFVKEKNISRFNEYEEKRREREAERKDDEMPLPSLCTVVNRFGGSRINLDTVLRDKVGKTLITQSIEQPLSANSIE